MIIKIYIQLKMWQDYGKSTQCLILKTPHHFSLDRAYFCE